jgi:hypothetical protein
MTHTASEVRRFDLFKFIVTLALLVLLIVLLIARSCWPTPAPAPTPTPEVVVPATEPVVEVEGTADAEVEEVAETALVVPTLDSPVAGDELPTGELTLSGMGEPGSEVQIVVDGEVIGVAPVGSDGKWSYVIRIEEPGEHEVVVQALDADEEVVAVSEPVSLIVAAGVVTPTLDPSFEGAELPAGELTLSGTGVPGSEVQIVVDGEVLGVAPVGSDGKWSYVIRIEEPGEHEVLVQALDADGEVVTVSEPVSVTVVAGVVAPELESPAHGAEVSAGELTLAGVGEPGTEVEILDNGVVVGVAQVGDDGQWRFTFEPEPGDHQLAVRAIGDETAVGGAVGVTVSSPPSGTACDAPAGSCTGDVYVVVSGDMLWCISRCADVNLHALIAANPEIENPDLIFPEQIIRIPR